MDTSECIGILKALSDETRMKIFGILREGKLCGCKILESLNITQPTLSEKEWKWSYYSINCEKLNELIDYFGNTKCRNEKEDRNGLYVGK